MKSLGDALHGCGFKRHSFEPAKGVYECGSRARLKCHAAFAVTNDVFATAMGIGDDGCARGESFDLYDTEIFFERKYVAYCATK